jgi:hypothetical protein
MGVLQTTYVERITQAVAGMVADMTISNIDTRSVETVAGIGFGLACGKGVDDKGVVLGATLTTDFVGISVRDITLPPPAAVPEVYARYASAGILTEGDIWAIVGVGGVVDGGIVTYVKTTGVLGSVAADANNFLVIGGRWMTTAAAGQLAVVRLTGPLGAV